MEPQPLATATAAFIRSLGFSLQRAAASVEFEPALRRLVLHARRLLARLAGLSQAEIDAALPLSGAKGTVAPTAMQPLPSNVHVLPPRSTRRLDMGLADAASVLPPNIERAVRTLLATSGRTRLAVRELERYLMGLGLSAADARGIVTQARLRTRREEFGVADLAPVQELVTRAWLTTHAADRGRFLSLLGEELGVRLDTALAPAELDAAVSRVRAALEQRGWSSQSAHGVLTHAVGRAASMVVKGR